MSCALTLWSTSAFGQLPATADAEKANPAPRQGTSAADQRRPAVEELDLPIYLKDKDGKLQHVPGFTLEEFDELWEIRNRLRQSPRPAATVTAVHVTGSIVESHAELNIVFTVVGAPAGEADERSLVGPPTAGHWFDVPLAIPEARLTAPAKYDGPGQHRLSYDLEKSRYIIWLSADGGAEHRLTLQAQVPVETQGHYSRLKLTLPAATESRMAIHVPRRGIVGELTGSSGGQLDQRRGGNETTFTIIGARGECQLAWRETEAVSETVTAALEAAGILAVKIDGRSAQVNARLTVSSLNQGSFDRFQLQLPRGAVYLSGQASDYSVQAIEEQRDGRQVLEFTRPASTPDPFTVYLTAELARDNPLVDTPLELGGFDVVGALQQYGHLVIEADENWRVLWEHGPNVRQISTEQFAEEQSIGLAEPLPIGRPMAAFEYFSQPFSFPVRIVPRTARVEVDPKYAFTVGPKWIGLDGRLKYTIRGTGVFSLDIDLPGWTLDPEGFQPGTVINLDELVDTQVTPLRIPLLNPTTGELEITFRATRAVADDADSISVELPRPHADFLHRAEVAIVPDDNVELSPRPDGMAGLSRQITSSMRLPVRQQPWLAYRAEQPDARFVADYQVHAGKVTVNLRSTVRLEQTGGNVRQQLDYFIAYEPLDQFVVEMPRALAESGRVEFSLNGQLLSQSRSNDDELTATRLARVQVSLPAEKRIGAGVLSIAYPLDVGPLAPSSSRVQNVPLVMPVGVELVRNELQIAAPDDWKIRSGSAGWTESGMPPAQLGGSELFLTATRPQAEVDIRATREDESRLSATTIDRGWIQTWLTPSERVERVLLRVVTGKPSMLLTLPAGAERVEVWSDGAPQAAARRRGSAELVVAFGNPATAIVDDGNSHRREHLVEIRYALSRPRDLSSRALLTPPRFASDVRVGRTYWQLVLPRDWHLLAGPEGYVNEFEWTWTGWGFARQPLLEQTDLEAWIGAEKSAPLPAGTNRYLFSSMQGLPSNQFHLAGRWQIVLVASAGALVAGLLLLYVPACRRPPALFLAGLAGLALAALYPDPAALLLQAASLGLGLTLVAVVLRRSFAVAEPAPRTERRSASSIVRPASHSSRPRPALVGSAASTETKAPASPDEIALEDPQS